MQNILLINIHVNEIICLLGFFLPAEGPCSWLSLSWHGWHTNWCPQIGRPDRPQMLIGGPVLLKLGISAPAWIHGWFLGRDVGMASCGWASLSIFGTSWSPSGPLFQVGICVVSSHRCSKVPISWLSFEPRAVFWVSFVPSTFLLFV